MTTTSRTFKKPATKKLRKCSPKSLQKKSSKKSRENGDSITATPDETDDQFIERIGKVSDAREACRLFVENQNYLGYDPYYGDLREALISMCERCADD